MPSVPLHSTAARPCWQAKKSCFPLLLPREQGPWKCEQRLWLQPCKGQQPADPESGLFLAAWGLTRLFCLFLQSVVKLMRGLLQCMMRQVGAGECLQELSGLLKAQLCHKDCWSQLCQFSPASPDEQREGPLPGSLEISSDLASVPGMMEAPVLWAGG